MTDKKTERLDIRISHETKKAFNEACEVQSDTPSNAVRRFVSSYIRRAKRDDLSANIRGTTRPKSLFILSSLAASLVAVFLIPKLVRLGSEKLSQPELFTHYDYDNSGLIEVGEISKNDTHLHRVLDIDGEIGISQKEFFTNGTMTWSFVEPDKWTVLEDTKNLMGFRHMRKVSESNFSIDSLPQGSLIPTGDSNKPFLTIDEFKALGKPIWDVQNIDVPPEILRIAAVKGAPSNAQQNKYVIFDLRNPRKVQIDVLEHKSHALVSKSLPYMRSVEWVEGKTSPHYVMGTGHDWWKSLQK